MSYDFTKRIIDIVFAIILGLIFSPVLLLTAIAIWLESQNPIFYCQKRIGKNGRIFTIFKFRSMINNADEVLWKKSPDLLEKFREQDWKLELDEDPRVTKVGKIIRRLTIDEMPQLLNVLKGEMSIIGPRAYRAQELTEQQERYPKTREYVKNILTVKPGITGPWQVSGRNEISFDMRTKMDSDYAKARSLLLDFKIILKTPLAMISKW